MVPMALVKASCRGCEKPWHVQLFFTIGARPKDSFRLSQTPLYADIAGVGGTGVGGVVLGGAGSLNFLLCIALEKVVGPNCEQFS